MPLHCETDAITRVNMEGSIRPSAYVWPCHFSMRITLPEAHA